MKPAAGNPTAGVQPLVPAIAGENFESLVTAGLTARECEVLGWVAAGKRDAEIAALLAIAPKTASKHVEHILTKLRVPTRTAAVAVGRDLRERIATHGSNR